MHQLENKVILVTGADDAIGAPLAVAFAKQGANVVLLGKVVKNLEAVYDEIEKNNGPQPALYPLHLGGATLEHYQELNEIILRQYGHLDGLVHASIYLPLLTPLHLLKPTDWAEIMHINLTAPFMLTQALIPSLQKPTHASVIFTLESHIQKAYWHSYAVAHAGLVAMLKVFADEWENQTICFNGIETGILQTPVRQRLFPGEDITQYPLPETIAPYYIDLLVNKSKGQIIEVN